MKINIIILLLLAGCSLGTDHSQKSIANFQIKTPYRWVDLIGSEVYEALEGENRLLEHCGTVARESKCVQAVLRPKLWAWPVYAKPERTGQELGRVVLLVTPGKGVEAYWLAEGQSKGVRFAPDDGTGDWGYGSPFLMTALDVRESWVLLPANPFPVPVWIDTREITEDIQLIRALDLVMVELNGRDLFILAEEGDELIVRDEQPADMWCHGGIPPELVDVAPIRIGIKDAYDGDLHLKFIQNHKKGC